MIKNQQEKKNRLKMFENQLSSPTILGDNKIEGESHME